jgi:hypothetical protein
MEELIDSINNLSITTTEKIIVGDITFIIDSADLPIVNQHKWKIVNSYVVSTKGIKLHRLLMNPDDNKDIDHRNGDPLDNRRCNLRVCNRSQNLQNRRKFKNNTSNYKGVTNCSGRFRARITIDRQQMHLGYYDNAYEAGLAYDAAARLHFGEFARLNHPLPGEASA